MKVICITNTIIIDKYKRNEPLLLIGKEYTLSNPRGGNWENYSNWIEEEQKWIPSGYFIKVEDYKAYLRDNRLKELGIC